VVREENGATDVVGSMHAGDIFGELALLRQCTRTASVRCLTPTDVIVVRKTEFGVLAANMPEFRGSIERVMEQRVARDQARSHS
jgi:CRP-like cAMP-binding protein